MVGWFFTKSFLFKLININHLIEANQYVTCLHGLLKLSFILYLVFASGQTYTREPSLPILRYSDPPPQPSDPPFEPEPPIPIGTYLVSLYTKCMCSVLGQIIIY
jgi:hypothetical protein